MQLSVSHLGYLPGSPKTVTLIPDANSDAGAELPERIPFYLRQNCLRMQRDRVEEAGFSARFPAPYDLLRGPLTLQDNDAVLYSGELVRTDTRWGSVWQADFSAFQTPGSYQIETDFQISPPFAIRERLYDRVLAGHLTFLRAQRCGCEVFGVHAACHLDDGFLDRDGSSWPVTGGWHDAGDFRKWLAFTQQHLFALATMLEHASGPLARGGVDPQLLREEITWGNRFFHGMIDGNGQIFEDVAGGRPPRGTSLSYERDWWFENHPGCFADATDNRWTDNAAQSGDERMVRTTYNPQVQWSFIATQARVSSHLPPAEAAACRSLARRALAYAREHPHDGRTLFLAAEALGLLELLAVGDDAASPAHAAAALRLLLTRQARGSSCEGALDGFFLEDHGDGYRSIAFSAEPALALLRAWELRDRLHDAALSEEISEALARFLDGYLLADSRSNPFGLTPYGVYTAPPSAERQLFREAGEGRGVRTFMHPYNQQGIVHGTSSVLLSHAHALARAAAHFSRPEWAAAADRLLQWCLGHNPLNRSLFSGIGYRHPVGYSFRIPQLPEAPVTGFIGRPDDSPYLEESTAIEWNTLEYWSVPFVHATQAACWLQRQTG